MNPTRWALIISAIVLILVVIFRIINYPIQLVAETFDINTALLWALTIIGVIYIAWSVAHGDGNIGQQLWTMFWLAIGQIIFVKYIYYGWLFDYLLSSQGTDPRLLLATMTALIIVVAGVIYFSLFSVFPVNTRIWVAYVLVSIFGTLLIAGSVNTQPFALFEHKVENTDSKSATATAKFWILREKSEKGDGKIIDVSWSPGISATYGKPLSKGTPADVEEVKDFLANKSTTSWLYRTPYKSETSLKKGQGNFLKKFSKETMLNFYVTKTDTSSEEHFVRVAFTDNNYLDLREGFSPVVVRGNTRVAIYALENCKLRIEEAN